MTEAVGQILEPPDGEEAAGISRTFHQGLRLDDGVAWLAGLSSKAEKTPILQHSLAAGARMPGKPLRPPPQGFMKSPGRKESWIVDEEAAAVVRQVFRLTLEGKGLFQIARHLAKSKIHIPAYHQAMKAERKAAAFPWRRLNRKEADIFHSRSPHLYPLRDHRCCGRYRSRVKNSHPITDD